VHGRRTLVSDFIRAGRGRACPGAVLASQAGTQYKRSPWPDAALKGLFIQVLALVCVSKGLPGWRF
jgi:hypothetical protein